MTTPRPRIAPEPIGLRREQAADYVGVSPGTFDEMVGDGRMPEPRPINSCLTWDREELYTAYKALPHRKRPAARHLDQTETGEWEFRT